MSAYSQPVGTITFNGQQNSPNNPFKPKYMKEDASTQRNSHTDSQVNKLPLNLFMSAAQYNKMLITCGKNRKRPVSHLNDGFAVNLEYINDQVFQKLNEERAIARENVQFAPKSIKKKVDECTCCCCKEFCQQCASQKKHCKNLSESQVKKALSTIDNQIALVRKGQKVAQNTSYKKHSQKPQFSQSRRAKSAVSESRSQNANHVQSHAGVDISHLIIRSLIQFEESRKKNAFLKDSKKNEQKARQEFMYLMNQKIRLQNYEASKNSRSKSKTKSLSKSKKSTNYWENVKQQVFDNLKKDNYSSTLKKQLMNYQFNIYEHKQVTKRETKLTKEQIKELSKKHENEAIKLIKQQNKQKEQKAYETKMNLRELNQKRLQHIQSHPHKKFRPTQEMINEAFKNIVEPKKVIVEEHLLSQLTRNQGLKKYSKNNALKSKKELKKP